MAFRHLGGSAKQALPGEMLLVIRKPALALISRMAGRIPPRLSHGM